MIKRIKGIVSAVILAGINPLLRSAPGEPAAAEPEKPPHGKAPETQKPEEAKAADERVRELEAELAVKAERLAALEKAEAEASGRAGRLEEGLKQAVNAYRGLLINSNPEIVPELISGESLAELDNALAKGRELTGSTDYAFCNSGLRLTEAGQPLGASCRLTTTTGLAYALHSFAVARSL